MLTEDQKRTAVRKLEDILDAGAALTNEIVPDMDLAALREALVKEKALLEETNKVIAEVVATLSPTKAADAQTDRVYY